jgi:hypothetical protein
MVVLRRTDEKFKSTVVVRRLKASSEVERRAHSSVKEGWGATRGWIRVESREKVRIMPGNKKVWPGRSIPPSTHIAQR